MEPNRWWIMSIRAAFLESEPTWYHGAVGVSVWTIISSLAREYSSHLVMDSRSMGESFHWRSGSFRRFWKRSYCTLSDTENQYLRRWMPSSTSICSKMGHCRMNRIDSCGVQNSITFSTPARLYQERSKSTISPAAGRCAMWRWKYHCVCSRSVGEGRAAIRATRGERYSVIRLMVPPLPAASRPSKMITTRAPVPRTHYCSFASSPWRRYISVSYVLLEILATWWGSGTSLTPAPCGDFLAMVQRIPAATRRGAGSDGIARRPEQRLTPSMTATPHGGPPRPAAPAGEYCDASLAHLLDLVTENAAEFHVGRGVLRHQVEEVG